MTFSHKRYIIQVTKNIQNGHLKVGMSIFTLERRIEVHEKLLEVGIELIKEKGIRKMTISEVTARAGIGKGTFYFNMNAVNGGGMDRKAIE